MSKYEEFDLDIKKDSRKVASEGRAVPPTAGIVCYTIETNITNVSCDATCYDCISVGCSSNCNDYTETCSACNSYCGGVCRR